MDEGLNSSHQSIASSHNSEKIPALISDNNRNRQRDNDDTMMMPYTNSNNNNKPFNNGVNNNNRKNHFINELSQAYNNDINLTTQINIINAFHNINTTKYRLIMDSQISKLGGKFQSFPYDVFVIVAAKRLVTRPFVVYVPANGDFGTEKFATMGYLGIKHLAEREIGGTPRHAVEYTDKDGTQCRVVMNEVDAVKNRNKRLQRFQNNLNTFMNNNNYDDDN